MTDSLSHRSETGWQIDRQTYDKPARHPETEREAVTESLTERFDARQK